MTDIYSDLPTRHPQGEAALPSPPVPSHADLRSFVHMPLDVQRLRDSGIADVEDAEGFRGAVLLWCAAWHQLPAGSLPTEERQLARLAGYGRDLRRWRRADKEGARRGWYECSDGRMYHDVVAEKVLAALDSKQAGQSRTGNARKTLEENRQQRKREEVNTAPTSLKHAVESPATSGSVVGASPGYRPDVDQEAPPQPIDIIAGRSSVTDGPEEDKRREEIREEVTELRSDDAVPAIVHERPVREVLWSDGLTIVRRLVGKSDRQSRRLLGRWLKEARDDCASVLRALRDADDLKPVDPIGWLTKAVKRPANSMADLADELDGELPP